MSHSNEPGTGRRPGLGRRTVLTALAAAGLGGAGLVAVPPMVSASPTRSAAPKADPDLGPNVSVFSPDMPAGEIQATCDEVFARQERAQFGSGRHAFLFKPGSYQVDVNVGFFTQVVGLGLTPGGVSIAGAVHAEADWMDDHNATQNFWRSAEGVTVTPSSGADRWAVSQAAPYRRMHVKGDLALDDGGWSSGGLLADVVVDGQVRSGTQQQWLSRNTEWGGWDGSNWNMVFVGARNAPADSFPKPPFTTVDAAPRVREKPFLYVDGDGAWQVFVPALRENASGTTWSGGAPEGESIPLSDFHIARTGESAAEINAALAEGRHLLLPPGVYEVGEPIAVGRPDTVVLGLGLATLVPTSGNAVLTVADVDGVKIAGVLVDAGAQNSSRLVEIGPDGADADHAANPTSLHDVFVRVGGVSAARATTSLVVNSSHVIADHMWLWRADHGSGDGTVGWDVNPADTGLVVNGDDVVCYGLFAEHYQKYQVVWNGERGRTYFFQNEMPYDPPDQGAWMNGATRGYAAYKVDDAVTEHEAWGLGSYCFFNVNRSVAADRAFEVPDAEGVRLHHLTTVSLGGGTGSIAHVVNDAGDAAQAGHDVSTLTQYP